MILKSEQPLQLLQYLEVQHENYVDIFLVVSPGQEQDWLKWLLSFQLLGAEAVIHIDIIAYLYM